MAFQSYGRRMIAEKLPELEFAIVGLEVRAEISASAGARLTNWERWDDGGFTFLAQGLLVATLRRQQAALRLERWGMVQLGLDTWMIDHELSLRGGFSMYRYI